MMLYRNTKIKVHSLNGDTDYFDIVASVLKRDALAPYLFIICLDYVLITSIDKIKENKGKKQKVPAKTITDYADDITLLTNTLAQPETRLHCLEQAAAGIGLHVNAHKTEYMCFNQTGDISTLNSSSETNWKVHQPRKQCFINPDRHQHMTSKGMDSYR